MWLVSRKAGIQTQNFPIPKNKRYSGMILIHFLPNVNPTYTDLNSHLPELYHLEKRFLIAVEILEHI